MNRRGFLARLFAAPIVALALLKAPTVEHTEGSFGETPTVNDPQTGIAIKFVRQFDIDYNKHPTRIDWIYS